MKIHKLILDRLLQMRDFPESIDTRAGLCSNVHMWCSERLSIQQEMYEAFHSFGLDEHYPIDDPSSCLTPLEQFNQLPRWEERQGELRMELLHKLIEHFENTTSQ